jgi:DNA-binding beta-propeller fold protein YncE
MRALVLLGLVGCTAPAPEPEPSTLLVSDYRANAIFRYDGVTGEFLGTFAQGSEQRVDRPAGVRLGPDGQLYTAGFGRGDVVRYDITTGQMMDVFYWDTRLLEEPVELVFDGAELVVLGNDTNNLVVLAPDGSLARTFGYPLIQGAHDFVIDADRRVLVATDTAVQVWDLASGTQLGAFGERDLQRATSIAVRGDTTYVADWDRDCITTFPEGRVLVAGLRDPISIEFFDDELYVLDANGVQRFDPDSGEQRGTLVARDDHMVWPRGFTFVRN